MTLNFGRFKGRRLDQLPTIYSIFLYINCKKIKQKEIRDYLEAPARRAHYSRSMKLFNKNILATKMKEFAKDI